MNFLDEALAEARLARDEGEVPVGAVIVQNGKIIARGRNQKETKQNCILHAEIVAIQEACNALKSWRLIDCDLYVTLEPCPMCLGALQQARVRKVFYGAEDAKGGAISLGLNLNHDLRLNHRFDVEHTENKSCGEILTLFFKDKRKKFED